MAIDKAYFSYLVPILKAISPSVGARVACLSYPDILLTPNEVSEAFEGIAEAELFIREDSAKICAWHGMKPHFGVTDTKSLFSALGLEADFFDMKSFRGEEIVLDLNLPLPKRYHKKYDLVIDTGTLEHCFNVGTAFINMCGLVKVGGVVLTQAPMSKINHGFWNFSPCVYENFFNQNNWELQYLGAYILKDGKRYAFKPPANARFSGPPESIIIAVAQRRSNSTCEFPTQQKYN